MLADAVRETAAAPPADGREGIIDAGEELHPDLHQEFTTVLTILANDRMDHHRVEVAENALLKPFTQAIECRDQH
ncbi:hypothetical protein [Streptomyces griseocarneus]|uniref:hypothetical protein n=1 Tax=Streptomyces griseocarneus TaxID=51201 RepID=UPI00167CEF51|nr:hypothetical protein [Streptomyces griseocarneus]MBZ6476210.1 hypothetical protein [Streptomyces griseocarneus]GHG63377.1 hypothetical protein GCM10018779_32930 [Streptomyces griseocarneus]